jgi:hypothetical protein
MSMEAVNPFAQMPTTPEPIIAQVRRTLAVDCAAVSCAAGADLDRVAEAAVRRLWDGQVKVFVPVLALREAREVLGVHETQLAAPEPEPAVVARSVRRRPRLNVLRLDGDVLASDERDVLTLDDDRRD